MDTEMMDGASAVSAVAISGSPSATSKSRRLLRHATARLAVEGVGTSEIDLAALPAEGLLGRSGGTAIERAVEAVRRADIIVVSTPVYRASYTGLLKVFFDLLPAGSMVGKVGIPIATGGVAGHQLVLDHGLRPLFSSLGAIVVPTGTYATDAEFRRGEPQAPLLARIDRSVREALALAASAGSGLLLSTEST